MWNMPRAAHTPQPSPKTPRKLKTRALAANSSLDPLTSLKQTLRDIDSRRQWVDQQIQQMTHLATERDRLNQQRGVLETAINQLEGRQQEMSRSA